MQPIQYSQASKIHIELLMMQIMHVSLEWRSKEIIPRMHCRRFNQRKTQPDAESEDVRVADGHWQDDRQLVGEDMLDGVSVLGCECHWCCKCVVFSLGIS